MMPPRLTPTVALAVVALMGLVQLGCPPGEAEAPDPTPAPKAEPPAQRDDLAGVAVNTSLVASPTELQEAMMHAGVDIKFGTLIQRREMTLTGADVESVALRTGIALADLVLTITESDKDVLLADLDNLRTGMKTIGGGDDIDTTIAEISDHVKADAVSRQELWLQVEEMREAAYGELGHEAGVAVVPLVQAGTWLEGTNLLAKAVLKAEEKGDAPNLLRQPDVVKYFLDQLRIDATEGPSQINTLARGTLEQMHDITMKDALTVEDVESIHKLTNDLLVQL